MGTLLDTEDRPWREHLQLAVDAAAELREAVTESGEWVAAMPALLTAVDHLTKALAGLVAAEPQVTRWQPQQAGEPTGNLPREDQVGASHLYPAREDT